MKFYRIEDSTNLKEVGIFPQRGKINSNLSIYDAKHLFTQESFTILSKDIYIPSFHLHRKAKLTDVISSPIDTNWIVSSKMKNIFEKEHINDIQFCPIDIYNNNTLYDYFLLRSTTAHMDSIDYSQTEILLKEVLSDFQETITVPDYESFIILEKKTIYPKYIEFKYYNIRSDCPLHFFSLKYTYGAPAMFVSDAFKKKLEAEKITGIRFMELDEVL